jgi:hypothetical protein
MNQLPHVCSVLVLVGLRRGIATHASPTAQPCGGHLNSEGEKEALALAHPHIDVIWLIDVTPVMMGMGMLGTQCKCCCTFMEEVHGVVTPGPGTSTMVQPSSPGGILGSLLARQTAASMGCLISDAICGEEMMHHVGIMGPADCPACGWESMRPAPFPYVSYK